MAKVLKVVNGRSGEDTVKVYRGEELLDPSTFTRMQLCFNGEHLVDSNASPAAFDFASLSATTQETVLYLGGESIPVGYYDDVRVYVFDAAHPLGALRGVIEAEVIDGSCGE